MKVRGFPLEFNRSGAMAIARDSNLFQLTNEFAAENLKETPKWGDFQWVLLACEVDENDVPVKVVGSMCGGMRPDFSQIRFTSSRSAKTLLDFARDFLVLNGMRGQEVFLYISDSETPEQRCPKYLEWMEAYGAEPSQRYSAVPK